MKNIILSLNMASLIIASSLSAGQNRHLAVAAPHIGPIGLNSSEIKLIPDDFRKLKIKFPSSSSLSRAVPHPDNPLQHPELSSQGRPTVSLRRVAPYRFVTMNDGSLLWPADLTPSSKIALQGLGAVEDQITSPHVVDLVRVALGEENQEMVEEAHAVKWFLDEHGKTPDNEFERRDLKSNFKPLFEQGLRTARGVKRVTVTGNMLKAGEYNFDHNRLPLRPVPSFKLNLYRDNAPMDTIFIHLDENAARNLIDRRQTLIFVATGEICSLRQTPQAAAARAFYADHLGMKVHELRIVIIGADSAGKVMKAGEFKTSDIEY